MNTRWDPLHLAYFNGYDDFLLRRHDYHVDVAGGFATAQYVHEIVEVDGFRYPTKRFAYVRGPNLKPIRDLLLVSINLSNFRFYKEARMTARAKATERLNPGTNSRVVGNLPLPDYGRVAR